MQSKGINTSYYFRIGSKSIYLVVIVSLLLLSNKYLAFDTQNIDSLIAEADRLNKRTEEFSVAVNKIYRQSYKIDYKPGIAYYYRMKGMVHYYADRDDSAIVYFNKSLPYYITQEDEAITAIIYNWIGNAYEEKNDRVTAIKFYNRSIELKKRNGHIEGLGYTYTNKGYCNWKLGQYDSAEVAYLNAIEICDMIGAELRKGMNYNNLAILYYHWAQYESAINYYRKSMEIRKKHKDHRGASIVYNNIGLVMIDIKQYSNAREQFVNAMKFALKSEDPGVIAYSNNCMGKLYFNKGVYDSALFYYNKSIESYVLDKNTDGLLLNYKDIGDTYIALGENDRAEEYLQRSLKLAKESNILLRIAENNMLLGKLANEKRDYKEAIIRAKESLAICDSIGQVSIARDAHKVLADAYDKTGNARNALVHYKEFTKLSSQTLNEETSKKIIEMEKTTEAEKNKALLKQQNLEIERQKIYSLVLTLFIVTLIAIILLLLLFYRRSRKINSLLKTQNDKIEIQSKELNGKNSELKELVNTKNKLFSIIAHDLKNPFFSILGFSQLLKNEYLTLSENEKILFINEISASSHNTYQMLENLLQWSKTQINSIDTNPQQFYIREVILLAYKSIKVLADIKHISFNFEIPDDVSVYADKDMIEIVMRNLMTNAVKFSDEKSEVEVGISKNRRYLDIIVKDNGIGMEQDLIDNFYINSSYSPSESGTKGEKGTGLGLMLSKEFVEDNEGTIKISSEENKGTKVIVSLPLTRQTTF